ncbi:MAG TPA: nucleotide exchange factor GrpE [Vicinamibacterales bacterium]|nr:nucleotide exchange factor GrpE [Vicinamibacterales bacterium]
MSEHQDPSPADVDGTDETESAPASPADQLQRERDEHYDRLLRKTAEFDNFRKRVERERKEFVDWAAADVLNDLLAVMDDFDRALATDAPAEAHAYKAGVELIHRALSDLVRKRGVTAIEALGADFDPHLHQAVAYEAVAGAREGEVVEELRKGYRLGERLLRPSLVKVAKAS